MRSGMKNQSKKSPSWWTKRFWWDLGWKTSQKSPSWIKRFRWDLGWKNSQKKSFVNFRSPSKVGAKSRCRYFSKNGQLWPSKKWNCHLIYIVKSLSQIQLYFGWTSSEINILHSKKEILYRTLRTLFERLHQWKTNRKYLVKLFTAKKWRKCLFRNKTVITSTEPCKKTSVFGHVLYEMANSKYKSPAIPVNTNLRLVLLIRVPQGVAKLCAVKDKNLEKPRHWSKVKQSLSFLLSSIPKTTTKPSYCP